MRAFVFFLSIFLLLEASSASAAIYRCMVDGKLTFSDSPCSGSDSKSNVYMEEKPKETNTQRKNFKSDEGPDRKSMDVKNSYLDKSCSKEVISRLEMRYFILDDEVKREEEKVKDLRENQESELDILRKKKHYSANNLAGATWEQSISEEMNSVTELYNNKIKYLNDSLQEKKSERLEIRNQIARCKDVRYLQ